MVSVRRVAPILLLAVMTLPAFAADSKAKPKSSSHPPRELHRVGDHWTPYNPPDPATYPPNAKTHTIKQGETLWGLATQYYGNGYLWPQLWESNTWITDAHWIYPGDVLLVQGEITQQAEAGAAGTAGTAGTAGGPMVGTTGSGSRIGGAAPGAPLPDIPNVTKADSVGGTANPVPLASEHDLYCFGYIGHPNEPMPNTIFAWEDYEVRYQPGAIYQEIEGSEGDLVFVTGGTSTGLTAGETYLIVTPMELVEHPRTHDVIGRYYEFRGQVRILCADANQSRGLITQSCSEIPIGSHLKPMPQLPIPLARVPPMPAFCDPLSGKTRGYIVNLKGGTHLESAGEGQVVQVNLGHDDQIQPGEFLTVFRDGHLNGQPSQVLGMLAVLTTQSHTATARIVAMKYAMRVGDSVEVR